MSKITDAAIIEALLSEPNISAAARVAGVHRSTIHNRLKDDGFCAQLENELDARRKALRAQSVAVSGAAVDTLADLLSHPLGVAPRDRIRAAEVALRHLQH